MNSRLSAWIVGGAAFLLLAGLGLWGYCPPLNRTQKLEISFPRGLAGTAEPVITTGVFGAADFLYVKYLDATTLVFGYDHWGSGGPESAPVTIRPGVRVPVQIELPALALARGGIIGAPNRLRVAVAGVTVLDSEVRTHPVWPARIFFGENPAGGSSCGAHFRGEIVREDGRALRGRPGDFLSRRDRIAGWLIHERGQVFAILLLSAAAAFFWTRRGAISRARLIAALAWSRRTMATHRWFLATGAVCFALFAGMITAGTFRFNFEEQFSSFYDYQAASLLQGRLDVAEEAISGEAFVVGEKFYGYFGVTPALLRLPFVIFHAGFGRLSRSLMLLDFAACLLAAGLILRHATRLIRGEGAEPAPWAAIVFTVNVGLGTTLFFLGSRAYIYHEAILCGAAFALGSSYCALRYLAAPAGRWWIGALACGVLAVHARPSVGLFALCLVGAVALVHLVRDWPSRATDATGPGGNRAWRRPLGVGALAVAGILSFNGLSYLKFGTFGGSPLRYGVQYKPERLAKFGGKNFHLSNLPHNFDAYVLRPGFKTNDRFPYIYFGGRSRAFPEAKIDLAESLLAFPYAMPGLFALAVVAGGFALLRLPAARLPMLVLTAAALPMALALFTAVVVSHRYTGDFCPFLICAGAFGLAALETLSGVGRAAVRPVLAALTLCSVGVTFALSLHFQGEMVWGVPKETQQRYQHLRQTVDDFVQRLR